MELLYKTHFGLSRAPFNVTPDPSFLYLSPSHKEALAQLTYGIKSRRGFVVLTGEVGTGKTTLTHALLSELQGTTQSALIFSTVVGPQDLLRYVCEDFGLIDDQPDHRGLHDYFNLLNRFLLDSYRKGENCALIIDEAQNLSAEVLESIRLLSNFETAQDKLLQILLVGQPELAVRLNSPELRQLKQRVTLRHHLRPLSFAECRDYIGSRLAIAGGDLSVFTIKALEAVYAYANGVPRLVNILCDNGMLTAYALGRQEVDAPMIQEVAEDLNLSVSSRGIGSSNGRPDEARPEAFAAEEKRTVSLPKTLGEHRGVEKEVFEPGSDVVPHALLQRLVGSLTDAMGPLAPLVVDEQIAALHERAESFPVTRWQELITLTSGEVLDARLKARFQQEMVAALHGAEDGRGEA
jgi:general secretion pathway protein A